jgi:hypothetical protein
VVLIPVAAGVLYPFSGNAAVAHACGGRHGALQRLRRQQCAAPEAAFRTRINQLEEKQA